MNRHVKIITGFILIVSLLLYFAVRQDSADSAKRKNEFISNIDKDIYKLEEEYFNTAQGFNTLSAETLNQIKLYHNSQSPEEKHEIFSKIISLSAADTSRLDQNNQLIRSQLDRLAGLINRREILMKKRE